METEEFILTPQAPPAFVPPNRPPEPAPRPASEIPRQTTSTNLCYSPTGTEKRFPTLRNFEPDALGEVRIRLLDGASTWKYID
jgi:hypothetical protein